MLDRRFHEVAQVYNLFTLVIRPPSNYHWIAGREKFHEKIRDNLRRKYECLCRYRFYDEFDEHQQVHSHYVFLTDASLGKDEFKDAIRGMLAKVWRHVEKSMPASLRPDHEDFFWDTPAWLVVEDDDFDWSVYCDTPRTLTGLARYLPKDLKDRSKVHPVPEGWPLRTRGGRDFFGKPMKHYWQETYRAWYPTPAPPMPQETTSPSVPDAVDEPVETSKTQADPPRRFAIARLRVQGRPARLFHRVTVRGGMATRTARGPPKFSDRGRRRARC